MIISGTEGPCIMDIVSLAILKLQHNFILMPYNYSPFPTIETDRLILRRITQDDADEIFFQRNDKAMNEYISRPTSTLDDARNWITRINDSIDANEWINWGVTLKGEAALIGGVCFWNIVPEDNKGEIGFSIRAEHWGKGLMQEAVSAALRYAFDVMKLETIEAYTHPENKRSVKLLERNNFRLTRLPKEGGEEPYAVYVLK